MVHSGVRTLVAEPSRFPNNLDEYWTKQRNRALAADVWQRVLSQSEAPGVSADYARGFRDGFTDHLLMGGYGESPMVPPRDYWHLENRNGKGNQRVADWFSGFHHGSSLARHGGYRDNETISAEFLLPYADDYHGEQSAWRFDEFAQEDIQYSEVEHGNSTSPESVQRQRSMPVEAEPEEVTPAFELLSPPEPDDGWRPRDSGNNS